MDNIMQRKENTSPQSVAHHTADNFLAKVLPKSSQLLLMLTLGLNGLTLVLELSGWLIAFIVISLLWQGSIYLTLVTQPNRVVKLLVSIAGLFLLALSAKQLGLLNTMVHLLVFSYLLKPLEIKTRKDFYIQVLLGIFVLTTSLVFIQSLYFMVLVVVILLVNLMLLMSFFYQPISQNQRLLAKRVALTLVQSMPLAVVLFVGFPKIAPFWQMPAAKNAEVGLSDEVKVGDIANLALSNKLAFRVEFAQTPPSYQQMYWRTLVLEDFDGVKWHQTSNYKLWQQATQRSTFSPPKAVDLTQIPKVNYQVIAEPSYQHWLFGLSIMANVTSAQQKIVENKNFTVSATKKISSVTSYQVTSALTNQINIPLSERQRQRNLRIGNRQLSISTNQALQKEGQRLRVLFQDDLAIVNQVLTRFNQQNYHYTLNPPLLSNNSLAEFYFETKSGFCEHYASSFTYLMRAAGIPARMVLGYLGGEHNSQGNYYSVYQRDAHAWSEVWIKGKGWIRIDPTAAVNPERVEKGFSSLLQQEQSLLSNDYFSGFNTSQWLNQLRHMLEAVDYQWTKWVVGYSINDQVNVIKGLYEILVKYKQAIIVIVSLFFVFIVSYLFLNKRRKKLKITAEIRLFNQLCELVATFGVVKTPITTVDQLAIQIIAEQAALKVPILEFVNRFKKIHYQALSQENKAIELAKLKRVFTEIKQLAVIKRS